MLVRRLSVKVSGEVTVFFSVMFRCGVSEETMYMCKTFATISTEGKMCFFFHSVLFLMTMISCCHSPIFDGEGLPTEGFCTLKTTNVS